MKKIYALTLLLALSVWVSGQTFVSEDFSSGTMPPSGWTIDAHAANWSAGASANAEGVAPEAVFFYSPSFNATSRLISPAVDLTGISSIKLMFKHFLDNYDATGYYLGVATRSGGGAWNDVWTVNPTGDIGPEEQILDISNSDVGAADFQFCIYFSGNSYNLDYWYIDDILLFVPYDVDAAMSSITTPSYEGEAAPVEGSFRNLGNNVITSAEVSWKVSDDMVYTTTFDGLNLAFGDSFDYSCTDLFNFPIGGYTLDVWVSTVNGSPDDNADNDMKSKEMHVYSHSIDRKPNFEEFTSSTCGPCASFNTSFNPWCVSHADDITLVKYQMNWPGSGDPYYTAEGGVRRNYYGVSYVPWPQCNGAYVDYNIGAVQAAFDNAILQPGLARIVASHSLDGTVITVNATVLPFADFSDFRAHIIVVEKTTTGNVSTNGETEFHNVMMKMIPDADGTTLNLNDREPITLTYTQDLASTNIEEYSDLAVVVLFQDFATKEIFQSVYSIENGTYNNDAQAANISYNDETVPGFSPDIYEYNIELPEGTTDIPVVDGIPSDPYATLVVVPTWELPGTTVVDVFADDDTTHMRYNVNFTVAVGIDEPAAKQEISIFPNPAKDKIYMEGARNADVNIFNLSGQHVISVKNFDGTAIDISTLKNGVYTVQAVMEDKSVVNRKITVLR